MFDNVYIIAEAGVNHNGDMNTAKKMIDVASFSGADAVKFQTFKTEKLVCKNTKKAPYQENSSNQEESQFTMLKRLELNKDMHIELMTYCKRKGIEFLSTPFDSESINLLNTLGLEVFKIPSGEITNLPYLRDIGRLKKKVILSTGMSDIKDIGSALNVLIVSGTPLQNITILHANTMYPTPMQDVNLKAMQTIRKTFNVKVGYSDHTLGIEVDIAAVALGAVVIEKHFTLDKNMQGPDHKASLEPNELNAMVKAIRNIELAMGSSLKKVTPSEEVNINIVRKSIIAIKAIEEGEILNSQNIGVKRPGDGISPMLWDSIIGTKAQKNYHKDQLI